MFVLESKNYFKDSPNTPLEEWWQVLINVESNFTAYVDGDVLVQDSHWCAVELAYHLKNWLKDSSQAFSYTSMDTEDENLLWFKPVGDGTWRVGSVWQTKNFDVAFKLEQIEIACQNYVGSVEKAVADNFGIHLTDFSEYTT